MKTGILNRQRVLKAAVQARQMLGLGPRVRSLYRAPLDLLFPPECVSCGSQMVTISGNYTAERLLCTECVEQLALFTGAMCSRCGAPLPDGAAPGDKDCYRCRGHKLWFDEAVAAGEYTDRLRELVLRMKPKTGDRVSLALGELLWHHCQERLRRLEADVVAPVPMHWRRRFAHGTNSAAVLAEVLARRLELPMAAGLLRRRRHTPPQFTLTPPQRWTNVRRVFAVARGHRLRKARVVLVDDILTSGATCSEAARALKQAGAERVTVVVVARALAH